MGKEQSIVRINILPRTGQPTSGYKDNRFLSNTAQWVTLKIKLSCLVQFCQVKQSKQFWYRLENNIFNRKRGASENAKPKHQKEPWDQKFALFNCTREMEMDNFGQVNSSLYFISIL